MMVQEPTSGVHALALALSAVSLALLGVDYYALIWGLFGALVALYHAAEQAGRVRAVVFVTLSTLCGAALGTGAVASISSDSRIFLIVASLVCGYGSQRLLSELLAAGINRIKKLGGQ